jgi:hypothetical protein
LQKKNLNEPSGLRKSKHCPPERRALLAPSHPFSKSSHEFKFAKIYVTRTIPYALTCNLTFSLNAALEKLFSGSALLSPETYSETQVLPPPLTPTPAGLLNQKLGKLTASMF